MVSFYEFDFVAPSLAHHYADCARELGYCCARAYAGGDCAHSMADWDWQDEIEGQDQPPAVVLDPVDGRPVPPSDF